ncbi:hypothetical protein D9758_001295 [Tetrapyrgos nigripes]|uniref:Uncharacterized protein n=1 Tax=Tetrapyrgos nigripes TaxID=182062 RepID=A0A8H5GRX4_9AGAR|nr:hypothetical protein D9758_001295 [Tetrapyrgos nigripes]
MSCYSLSPPSSPSVCIDSSPPSSPNPDTLLEPEWSTAPTDPFAASAKAIRPLHLYEKKRPVSPVSDSPEPKRARFNEPYSPSDVESPQTFPQSLRDEDRICDLAIENAFNSSHLNFQLESKSLRYIPTQFLRDLSMIYIPSEREERKHAPSGLLNSRLSRVATTPASSSDNARMFLRTASVTGNIGLPREKIQLFFGSNHICYLPHELFSLNRLTVLSLRNNNLSFIPPEIFLLKNLETLNVAANRLQFLPAEIKQLKLEQLLVSPNPFLMPPKSAMKTPSKRTFSRTTTSKTRLFSTPVVSSTIPLLPRVPPLFEICLRLLFGPLDESSDKPLLSQYEPPIDDVVPSSIWHFVNACHPSYLRTVCVHIAPPEVPARSSTAFEEYLQERQQTMSYQTTYRDVTGLSCCPSPRHGAELSRFVMHAEEKFTWENTIAGVSGLGQIPLRWRGCQLGCLDFLDGSGDERLKVAPAMSNDDNTFGGVDDGNVVQELRISSQPLAFEDFD